MVTAPTQSAGGRTAVAENTADESLFSNDNLLKLLSALRGSAIPKDEKMELRDLVLEFSQTHDDALRTQLKTKLEQYRTELGAALGVAKQESRPTPAPAAFGRTRVQPVFSAPVKPSEPSPVKEEAPPPPEPETEETSIPPVQEKPVDEAPPVPPKQADPVPEEQSSFSGDAKQRILEIKRAVNDKVGNPVNLMDANREVGQEYMAALLDAIKQSSGAGGRVGAAMQRLETAFTKVEEVLADGTVAAAAKEEEKTHVAEPAAVEEPPVPPPPPEPEEEPLTPTAPPVPPKQEAPTPERKIPIRSVPDVPPPPPKEVVAEAPPVPPKQEVSEPAPMPPPRTEEAVQPVSTRLHSLAETPPARPAPAATKPPVSGQEPASKPRPYAPQPAKHAPPLSSDNAPIPPQPEPVAESDLTEEKVEAGLRQLLDEWKLFKSSGFFGTGPHGIQHPLYLKLAKLPLAAVIAGRFEGATPEIKQTIADYMNGWRYEHGVVHKMEEHFEHYLRRVVAVILKTQKGAQKAAAANK